VVTGEYRVIVGSPLFTIFGDEMEECP
jgi:hypothetical protein